MIRTAIAFAFLAGVCLTPASGQTGQTRMPPLALESLTGGDSFDRYCASCHGSTGAGNGPVAASLKTRPADLTTIASRNGGAFPRQRVASYVEGTGRPVAAHGSSEMPVWGTMFRGLESSSARVKVRLDNLVAYVESLQASPDTQRSTAPAAMTGGQLFRAYCASCHGENARGTGPMASQLKSPAPDLTTFTARNGGVFPAERVRQMIEGRGPAVHGDRNMPIWGEVFKRQDGGTDAAARIEALVSYVQSIQGRSAE